MEIIPAIDLRNGKCVRLYQGDYSRETVFSDDPAAMALRWQSEGAKRLHLVDLDGAARGEPGNVDSIKKILSAVKIPVQVGGGIRTVETVEQLLALGVGRAILGTAAVENPVFVEEACRRFGEHVVIGIDAREGRVATRGWLQQSQVKAGDLAARMVALGAGRFICTDISRDGTLTSPNFEGIAEFLSQVSVPVIAAGGISSAEHLRKLAALGVEGAIVGRAIYTGDIALPEALAAVSRKRAPKQAKGEGASRRETTGRTEPRLGKLPTGTVKFNENGLLPAIAQDAKTGEVLMMAYMNQEALERTLSTKQAWFYSRSRKELWHKGATSGNYLNVKKVLIDCDEDTILLLVDAAGPACHTGNRTCFFRELGGPSVDGKNTVER